MSMDLSKGEEHYLKRVLEVFEEDPSEMGFKSFTELIQESVELDISNIMLRKLDL